MNQSYAKAPMLTPPRIMGVQLRPFSAWHAHVLCVLGNPAVIGGRVTLDKSVQTVLVCADAWHEDHRRNLHLYRRFMRRGLTRMRFWWRALRADEQRVAREIVEYVNAYLDGPEYWTEKGGKRSRIPVAVRVAGVLVSLCGIREERAWNMPLNLALAYQSIINESNGADIVDKEESDRIFGTAPTVAMSGVN